jgi:hypothetical protein
LPGAREEFSYIILNILSTKKEKEIKKGKKHR